jgi:2'-5' RNA ligase
MAKELMWVCALLPEELNQHLAALCKAENKTIGMPTNVFRFPLHISMKKSFQTTAFESVKAEILHHIQLHGEISCQTANVTCHKKMLWLPVNPARAILDWHNSLDARLLDKFGIPIDRFDANFAPHISLFTKGNQTQLEEMRLRLAEKISPMELTLHRFVIGSSLHGDAFFTV